MAFTIEDGISVPERFVPTSTGRKSVYPLADLQPGQSFMVPQGEGDLKKIARNLRTATARLKGSKFTVRTVDGGVRVWRVS